MTSLPLLPLPSDQQTFTVYPGAYLHPSHRMITQIIFDDPEAVVNVTHLYSGRAYPKMSHLIVKRCREIIWPATEEDAVQIRQHCENLGTASRDRGAERVGNTTPSRSVGGSQEFRDGNAALYGNLCSSSLSIEVPMKIHGPSILSHPHAHFSAVNVGTVTNGSGQQVSGASSSAWSSVVEEGGILPSLILRCETKEEYDAFCARYLNAMFRG